MTTIEDTVEAAGEFATEAAEEIIDVATEVASYAVEAIVEGVDAAAEAASEITEAVRKDGSILVRLLVVAGLVALAIFIYKRLTAVEEPEAAPVADDADTTAATDADAVAAGA